MLHKEIFCRVGKAALSDRSLIETRVHKDFDGKVICSIPGLKPPRLNHYTREYSRLLRIILPSMGIIFSSFLESFGHKKNRDCKNYIQGIERRFAGDMAMIIFKAHIATNSPDWDFINRIAKKQLDYFLFFSQNKKDQLSLIKAIVLSRELENKKPLVPCSCATEFNKTPLYLKYRTQILGTLLPEAHFDEALFNFLIDDDFNKVLKKEMDEDKDYKVKLTESEKLYFDDKHIDTRSKVMLLDLPDISKDTTILSKFDDSGKCLDLNQDLSELENIIQQ